MDGKISAGRIRGIPVVLDQTFIVLVLLFGWHYLKSGKPEMILCGLVIAVGGVLSILIHELAHAWAGRVCGIDTTHIELNGLGGLCFLEHSARDSQQSVFISLIGPASNLALWALFYWLASWASYVINGLFDGTSAANYDAVMGSAAYRYAWHLWFVLSTIAYLNMGMFVLNIMPSFPLDGGNALASALSERRGVAVANCAVGYLGLLVCLGLIWYGIKYSMFALVLAYWLFEANREKIDFFQDPPWKRWN